MEAEHSSPADDARGARASVKVEEFVAALAMGLLCLITMANVIVRYFTNISFAFTEEISIWLMVVMTLVGASAAFVKGQHIAITYFAERLPAGARRLAALAVLVACALMFALLGLFGVRMAWDDFRYEVTSPALDVPQWLYTVWLPLLSLLIFARLAQLIVTHLRRRGG